MDAVTWVRIGASAVLALTIPAVVWVGYLNRKGNGEAAPAKGIGWQYLRYIVLGIGLPLTGLLALNDALTGEAATILAASMGYAFGKSGDN